MKLLCHILHLCLKAFSSRSLHLQLFCQEGQLDLKFARGYRVDCGGIAHERASIRIECDGTDAVAVVFDHWMLDVLFVVAQDPI